MSDLDAQAIQERAKGQLGWTEMNGHRTYHSGPSAAKVAQDVLALLADRAEREQKIATMNQNAALEMGRTVGWEHRALAAEADREAQKERIENLRAALVTVTELSPHRQLCEMPDDTECEACVATAALAADDEAAL